MSFDNVVSLSSRFPKSFEEADNVPTAGNDMSRPWRHPREPQQRDEVPVAVGDRPEPAEWR